MELVDVDGGFGQGLYCSNALWKLRRSSDRNHDVDDEPGMH